MMTVRFPNGFSIQYNDANYANRNHGGGYTDLYTKEGGRWIAQVPREVVIEVVPACRTYQAIPAPVAADVARELRLLKQTVARLARGGK